MQTSPFRQPCKGSLTTFYGNRRNFRDPAGVAGWPPGRAPNPNSLTVHNAAASDHALSIALVWWSIALVLAVTYFFVVYRLFFRRESR
jgi:hypothetical protein